MREKKKSGRSGGAASRTTRAWFHHAGEGELVWPLLLARVDLEADVVLRMEAQHEVIARTLEEAAQRMPAWRSAPSAATVAPLAAGQRQYRRKVGKIRAGLPRA